MKYLFRFGYETPELMQNNDKFGWDDEDSDSVFVIADSEEGALEWGREIAERFVHTLFNDSTISWKERRYEHWIESDPEEIKRVEQSGIPIVITGFHPARESDVDSLVELESHFYAEEGYAFDRAKSQASISRLLREPNRGRIWVAAPHDKAAGYLILTFGYSIEFGGLDAIVDELYFAPESRRQGLGKLALALAEAACIELGIRSLHLEVERENVSAQDLYRKSGFKDHNRYLMTKFLS
jgi:ribosomal protein S18 acetylase RimI-like enzyme